MDPAPRIDPLAQAFAGIAHEYERGRPEYSSQPVDWAWQELELTDSSQVLDLAAGTGKLSRLLVQRTSHLVAVDPLAGMREVLAEQVPGATVLHGMAEEIPLDDGSMDAVFVAEAFHWFDGDRALREIDRVLGSGGGLVLLFGHSDWEQLPWNGEFLSRLESVDRPDVRPENRPWTGLWKDAFARTDRFGPLRKRGFSQQIPLDVDALVALVRSWSFVAAMPDADRDELLADAARIIRSYGVEQFDLPSTTDVYLTTRRA